MRHTGIGERGREADRLDTPPPALDRIRRAIQAGAASNEPAKPLAR
jgi:hypothetical protein